MFRALALVAVATGCAQGNNDADPLDLPAAVDLDRLLPTVLLPKSTLILEGHNFSTTAAHTLELAGTFDAEGGAVGHEVRVEGSLTPVNPERAEVLVDEELFASFGGEGVFRGAVSVRSRNAAGETRGSLLPTDLRLARHLTPTVSGVVTGVVHLNTRVLVEGDGFLLGGLEGQSQVELKGCFLLSGTPGPCTSNGKPVNARLPVTRETEGDRRRGTFEFSPNIGGIRPGSFEGTVRLYNAHPDSKMVSAPALPAIFRLDVTRLERVEPTVASLGQYVEVRGAGFVGGVNGSTTVRFAGAFTPHDASGPTAVSFEVLPGYKDGGWVRYVLEDGHGVGEAVNLRTTWGTLAGTWTPVIVWGSDRVEGEPVSAAVRLAPIKQVVWVRFGEGWSDTLRLFGLNAADQLIRQRIFEVLRRDYAGVNVEFRDHEPEDFKAYAEVDLTGQDPNALGLLGYDNTPGKDIGNKRLTDCIGGVNALTQQDGSPGYGGVFLESMFGFSESPPLGITRSPLHTPLFDQIFDPFRRDRGRALTTAEVLAAPALSTATGCPAADRSTQTACAIRVLGNLVGSTTSHELGHSLGLANPDDPSTSNSHDPGDAPNRLMDGGGARPFDERAELGGQGPAVFCDGEYLYLKKILPPDPPTDPAVERPTCY